MAEAQVEETVARLAAQRGVLGVLVATAEGAPVRSTLGAAESAAYGALAARLSRAARDLVRDADPGDELTYLRVRSARREVMVAPSWDRGRALALVVVQDPAPLTGSDGRGDA